MNMPFDGEVLEGEILEDDGDSFRVTIIYNALEPTDRTQVDLNWVSDKPLVEYMDGLPEGLDWIVITPEGVIEREAWKDYLPAVDDRLVLMLSPNKGGQILMLLAVLALSIASAGIGAAYGAALASATGGFLSTAVAGSLISGVVMALGGALIMALGPKVSSSNNQSAADSPSYSINGSHNTAAEGIPVPYLYGEYWTAGNCINSYEEDSSNGLNQIGYWQYVISEGPISSIEQIRINDQPSSFFNNVTIETRLGTLDQTPIGWFASQITQYNNGQRLDDVNSINYNTHNAIDKFAVNLTLPNGLYNVNQNSGKVSAQKVGFAIFYAPVGTSDWTPVTGDYTPAIGWNPATGDYSWVSIDPNDQYTPQTNSIRVTVEIQGSSGALASSWSAAVVFTNQPNIVVVNVGGVWKVRDDRGLLGLPGTIYDHDGSKYFNQVWSGSGVVQNSWTLDPNGGPQYIGGTVIQTFEIDNLPSSNFTMGVVGGTIIGVEVLTAQNNLILYGPEHNALNYTIHSPPIANGYYTIKILRTNPQQSTTQSWIQDEVICSSISEILADPVAYVGTATYAVRLQVTNQLSSQPQVTVLVKGRLVNIYDQYGNVTANAWSNNPADIALDILLNWRNRFSISPSRVDFASFNRLRATCAANGYTFNGVFDFSTTMWDALSYVLRVGHASIIMSGVKWSIILDAPSDPVMMFTMNNITKDTFNSFWIGTESRFNSIEVQFYDKLDYNKQHSQFAIDYNNIANGAQMRSTTINAIGVVDAQTAANEAQLQLNKNLILQQGCSFDASIEAIGCVVGDVVYVQHDMPSWGYSAIVSTVNLDGTFTIDSDVPFDGTGEWNILLIRGLVALSTMSGARVTGSQFRFSGYSTLTGAKRIGVNSFDYEVLDEVVVGSELVITVDQLISTSISSTSSLNMYALDVMYQGVLNPIFTSTAYPLSSDINTFQGGMILNENGSQILSEEYSPSTTNLLSIASWNGAAGTLAVNDRIMIGKIGRFMKPFTVTKIGYKDKHERTIETIEYNATIYNGAAAIATPNYSTLTPSISQVRNLTATQSSTQLQGGAISYTAICSWGNSLSAQYIYAGATVFVADSLGTGLFAAVATIPAGVNVFSMPAIVGDIIRFKVVAFDTTGSPADISSAPIAAVQIGSSARVPVAPANITVAPAIQQITLAWTVANTDGFVNGVEIWENQTANTISGAAKIWNGNATAYTRTGIQMGQTWYYFLRTTSIAGTFSPFVGPIAGTPTFALTNDIGDSIINAAKFAAGLAPVNLITNLSGTGSSGQIYLNESDHKLYKWVVTAGVGAWVNYINAPDLAGQLTASQITSLTAAQLTGQIVKTQIGDSQVDTAQLNAGAVNTAKLAAGAVTTSNLAVGSGTNLCWNPNVEIALDGWNFSSDVGWNSGTGLGYGSVKGTAYDPTWRLVGFGSGYLAALTNLATNSSQALVAAYDPNYPDTGHPLGIPCTAGQVLEIQARLMPHRCCARVQIAFFNAAGGFISFGLGTRVVMAVPSNGTSLDKYVVSWGVATVPATATMARGMIVGFNDGGSDIPAPTSPPFLFWTQFSIGVGVPNATGPMPWTAGGVSSISGGMIKTNTLNASAIVASSITADKMAANSVIAGTIQAGAINANEIAAGTIKAAMLASAAIITQSIQIGNALIQTAHIGDLQVKSAQIDNLTVGTSNIANSAITHVGSGTGTSSVTVSVSTVSGSPTLLFFTYYGTGTGSTAGSYVSLLRGGTTIHHYNYNFGNMAITACYVDTSASTGITSYTATIVNMDPGPIDLIAMTVKK
jgi:hypothetical protein